ALEPVVGRIAHAGVNAGDAALAAVGLLERGVEEGLAGAPDVGAGAVALDEGDDGAGGDVEAAVRAGLNAVAGGDGDDGVRRHEESLKQKNAGRRKTRGVIVIHPAGCYVRSAWPRRRASYADQSARGRSPAGRVARGERSE